MKSVLAKHDPKLDLIMEREVDVPVSLVWKVWTTPEHLKQWFCPRPWSVTRCEIDLRPGGIFSTMMRSPEGQEFPQVGCYLEIIENERLVFTDTLLPGYRPSPTPFTTAVLELSPLGPERTRYVATAIHSSEDNRKKHEQMGFHDGWNKVASQMVEYIKAGMIGG
jgi:uncharacterized protein YndB with AHSA1/START domain